MAEQKSYRVGAYVRLSREDSRAGESVSIENQKLMLVKYVSDMGWELKEIYQDDGFSGTNQNRPAFQRMLADVRSGYINTIVIKDLSRLGRNYLEVGNLAEVFLPEHGCELISLSEQLDDMMVFRNWFNEQHSKSTGAKVKASRRICAQNGKFLGTYAPYGYRKAADNHHKLMPDEKTAHIVRDIFSMRAAGMSFRSIAAKLSDNCILPPREYYYQQLSRNNPRRTSGMWSESTIRDIIGNEAYIGNMVQGKAGTVSYKNRKIIAKPKDEWIRADAVHEALIERDLWDRAHAISDKRPRPRSRKDGGTNLFTGLLYCADCGFRLRGRTERREGGVKCVSYMCGTYAHSGKNACTIHSISESDLYCIVTDEIRARAELSDGHVRRIADSVLTALKNDAEISESAFQSELEAHKRQIDRLEILIENLYADKASGLLSESMFCRQSRKYIEERVRRIQLAEELEQRLAELRKASKSDTEIKEITNKYMTEKILDSEAVLLLIDRITVGQARYIEGERICDIEIVYNFATGNGL